MNQDEQGKKPSQVIPAKPTGELSEQDLAGVAGGKAADPRAGTAGTDTKTRAMDDANSAMQQVSTTR